MARKLKSLELLPHTDLDRLCEILCCGPTELVDESSSHMYPMADKGCYYGECPKCKKSLLPFSREYEKEEMVTYTQWIHSVRKNKEEAYKIQ